MMQCVGRPWQGMESFLNERDLEYIKIRGNGLCMINAIITCMNNDYGTSDSTSTLMDSIFDEIQWNASDYAIFHTGNSEEVVNDTRSYFNDKKYYLNVADVCLYAAAEVLKVNTYIHHQ